MATLVPNGLQLSGFSPTRFQQLDQTKIGLSRWGRQDKSCNALSSLDSSRRVFRVFLINETGHRLRP